MKTQIILATGNKGKIREFTKMFSKLSIETIPLSSMENPPTIIEDGQTFFENAIKKAETISRTYGLPALADDSGLEVDALGGDPGIYSARFAGPQATDKENNAKLISLLNQTSMVNRTARYVCALALSIPGKETMVVEETCEGLITLTPKGENGFGYDPYFYLPEWGVTMAQMSEEQKNKISHRGKALKKLEQLLMKEHWLHLYSIKERA
ncbi:XTP/dITP diphosphatase [Microaerobacter geothermalis]|uniref:XTP/dITP diphosphatase n=1 Tax=Microaerobacter geothermalis TaxID=674972 RepID=UPI001F2D7B76|nr:XTP/dITP diphosphatase [Microaerobacter geothermalis]MCF6092631.1 XTP/dITP diphosphatase [Microaerobacter geothermalis]